MHSFVRSFVCVCQALSVTTKKCLDGFEKFHYTISIRSLSLLELLVTESRNTLPNAVADVYSVDLFNSILDMHQYAK